MAPKKAAAVPKKQSTLFEFGGKEAFKLKIYQHVLREHQEEEEEEDEEDDADIDVRNEEAAIPTEAQRTNPATLTLRLNLRR